jgi:hypothetical protein
MTIVHFVKIIPVKIKRIFSFIGKIRDGYKRMRDVNSLLKLKERLKDRIIEKERQNTDGTRQEAFGMECQIKVIDWILGKDVRKRQTYPTTSL